MECLGIKLMILGVWFVIDTDLDIIKGKMGVLSFIKGIGGLILITIGYFL